EVLIVFGDTICDFQTQEVLQSPTSQIGLRRVEDPRTFGVAEIDDNFKVVRVVEKPLIPKSNMAMVGIYKIRETESLFNALDKYLHNRADGYGEYHLTHALQTMIEQGITFKGFRVDNWFDCGKKETLLETNATLLKSMSEEKHEESYGFPGSVIIPPVYIGTGCVIEHSIIGPSVSIGENTVVRTSIVRNSIIGSFAELDEVVLKSSIIG